MNPKSIVLTLLFVLPLLVYSQEVRIGEIDFEVSKNDVKPKGTLVGQLEVYEDNILNTGQKISLYIEVLPALVDEPKNAPMFIIMGGPGQASSNLISFFSSILGEINKNSDLVFIDQRGTGNSNPLKIPMEYDSIQDYFKDLFMSDQIVKGGYESLSEHHNLNLYGTTNAILDIEQVRIAMGYDKINLYGTSYGTRVALTYINTFPENVRTATLKGLVPNTLTIPLNFAKDSQRSLELLLEACSNSKDCSNSFPNFEQELNTFLNGSFPIAVEIHNEELNTVELIEIPKTTVVKTLRSLLSVPTFTQQIPFLISEANGSNYLPLAELILRINRSYANGLYDGMMLCVICYEDYPRLIKSSLEKSGDTFLQNVWVDRVINACEIWNPEKREVRLPETQVQEIPVLLISGGRDSATPPKYGEEVLDKFPNGRHLIIENAGHSFDRMLGCVENIINEFVITANSAQLDTECTSTIQYPDFKLN